MELPPRARRILLTGVNINMVSGTTSACAENTVHIVLNLFILRNYLRVRGEYPHSDGCMGRLTELPPRARRILTTVTRSV